MHHRNIGMVETVCFMATLTVEMTMYFPLRSATLWLQIQVENLVWRVGSVWIYLIERTRPPAWSTEVLMLCKGTDNLPYTIRHSQDPVRQSSTRSFFRPVLVGEVTSTTSRRDQYCLPGVTSTGPIADQYWSHLPPAVHSEEIAPKQVLLIRDNPPYYND